MNYEREIENLWSAVNAHEKRIKECRNDLMELRSESNKQFQTINSKLDQIIEKSTITQTNKRAYLNKEIVYDEFGKQGIGKKRALNEIEKKYCVKRSHDNCRTHSITYDGRNFRGIIIIKR